MAEKGQVVNIKENFAIVKMVRTEACAKCRACLKGMNEQEMLIEAENACEASAGDWVEIELKDNGFFNAVLIMYGIPLIALLSGILIGYFAIAPVIPQFNRDLLGCFVGIIFMLLAFLWIRSQEKRWSSKKYRPIAVKKTQAD